LKNRRNIFAIVRWRHTEQGFELSWPLLHLLSGPARITLLGAIALWLGCVAILAFAKGLSPLAAAALMNSLDLPSIVFYSIVILIPASTLIVLFDFVLLKRLVINSKKVVLRKPWGATQSWPRSNLTDVSYEITQSESLDGDGHNVHTRFELILNDGSSEEYIEVGGTMSPATARELHKQMKRYTRKTKNL